MKILLIVCCLLCCACAEQPTTLFTTENCQPRQGVSPELASCHEENTTKKELLLLAPRLSQGMSMQQVEQVLAGHKPYLRYSLTTNNDSIWEFDERHINTGSNDIYNERLWVRFDGEGKVQRTLNSACLIPEKETGHSLATRSNCYEKRRFPFDVHTLYDAVKELLIISNYQVEHSDAGSLIISAQGRQEIDNEPEKMLFIKLTAMFRAKQDDDTEVIISGSFNVSEKHPTWVQAGFGGVTLPVPLPFEGQEAWIATGVVTPQFYLNFYDTLSALIASEFLAYNPPNKGTQLALNAPLPAATSHHDDSIQRNQSLKDDNKQSLRAFVQAVQQTQPLPVTKSTDTRSKAADYVTNNTFVITGTRTTPYRTFDSERNLKRNGN